MPEGRRSTGPQRDQPSHPHLQAGLMMAGIVVLIFLLALASAVA